VKGGGALTEAADAELLAAAARGDRDAFAVLYDRHSGPVYRFCL
jgi:DNA-directed RNA polymerase specialized sigma24 family protein